MTTGVEIEAPPASPRTRQTLWSRWVAGGAFVVFAAASVALLTERATYQPLASEGGSLAAGLVRAGDAEPTIAPTIVNVLGIEWQVKNPTVGDAIFFDFTLENAGEYGVRIVSIGPMPLGMPALEAPRAFMSGDPTGLGQPSLPFKPFTLRSGAHRDLRILEKVTGCPADLKWRPSQGSAIVDEIPVTYSFLGATHTTYVKMPGRALSIFGLPYCSPLDSDPAPAS